MYLTLWRDSVSQSKDDRKMRPAWFMFLAWSWGAVVVTESHTATCGCRLQSVLWGKDEGNTGRSHPMTICGSRGFPHLISSGHWACGIDLQEIKEEKGRGAAQSLHIYFHTLAFNQP